MKKDYGSEDEIIGEGNMRKLFEVIFNMKIKGVIGGMIMKLMKEIG